MSWWETGRKRTLIGDAPADRIADGLTSTVNARQASKRPAPTLVVLLSSLSAALDGRERGRPTLVAKTSRGEIVSRNEADATLTSELADILSAVDQTYRDKAERDATVDEILACFLFVLGYKPELNLSEADGLQIDEIERLEEHSK